MVKKINVINNSRLSDLVKKTDFSAKIKYIEKKCFTIFGYNKFTNDRLHAKIKDKKLVNECHIFGFINDSDLDEKIKTLATKAELKAEQDKIATLQMHGLSYFIGNNLGRGGGL